MNNKVILLTYCALKWSISLTVGRKKRVLCVITHRSDDKWTVWYLGRVRSPWIYGLTYLSVLTCCGTDCCAAGRTCRRMGGECSPRLGRRSSKRGHRTSCLQERDPRAGNGRQRVSHGRGKCGRVPGSAAGVPGVRAQTLGRPIWRDRSHSDCQTRNP